MRTGSPARKRDDAGTRTYGRHVSRDSQGRSPANARHGSLGSRGQLALTHWPHTYIPSLPVDPNPAHAHVHARLSCLALPLPLRPWVVFSLYLSVVREDDVPTPYSAAATERVDISTSTSAYMRYCTMNSVPSPEAQEKRWVGQMHRHRKRKGSRWSRLVIFCTVTWSGDETIYIYTRTT